MTVDPGDLVGYELVLLNYVLVGGDWKIVI